MARRAAAERKTPDEQVRFWLSEIEAAKKREKDYRKEGHRIREIYAGDKPESTPFNILFSNTETMLPALYSAIPRPVVERRYKDDDALGKIAATAGQRMLEFLVDTNIEGYETFNGALKGTTLDALLPGRGVSSIKYDADVYDVSAEPATSDAASGAELAAAPAQAGTGDGSAAYAAPSPPAPGAAPAETIPVKTGELVCPEHRSWDRVYFGYAKKWTKVPWLAYEEYIDRKEATRLFGKDIARKIKYNKGEDDEDEKKRANEDSQGERKTALVYQIWDKNGGKKVCYVSPQYPEGYLKEEPDPLGLTGFFNCPEPLHFVDKTNDLLPTPLYCLYENQAAELNSLTVRIGRLVKAIKARGVYDSTLGDDIANIMEADDNALVPSEEGSLVGEKGLDKAIWFMPIEKLQQVLSQLYVAREQCKQVIYEIIGIADILRGASKASETLGAQQIKNQWGTLRLKPKQAEVQRFARDLLRMMLEIAASKFSEETWGRITGLPYLTEQQFSQQTAIAQAAAQQGNPQPLQQLQQMPRWSQVLGILRDDLQRAYKIDIETNSTLEPEAAEDQKNIADLMGAIGQFLNGVGPLVQQGVLPFQTAQSMLLAITRRFRFGSVVEDQILQMKAPEKDDSGAKDAATAAAAAAKDMQAQQQQMKDQARVSQLETELKAKSSELQLAKEDAALQLRELKLENEQALFKIEKQAAQDTLNRSAQTETQKLEHKRQLGGLESKQLKTEQNIGKAVDTKMAQSVTAMAGMIETLVTAQGELLRAVAQQAEETQQLVKLVKAPRRRRAIRDPSGNITESVEEVLDN